MNGFGKKDSMVVKGTAILMLLFYHLYYDRMMFMDQAVIFTPFSAESILSFSQPLNICVNVFLFISVYGFYVSLRKTEESNNLNTTSMCYFVGKRYVSLLLGFCPVYFASLAIFWKSLNVDLVYGVGYRRLFNIFLDATGLVHFGGNACLNMSWWYLKVLISVIFTMPFLFKGIRKWKALLFFPFMLVPYFFETDLIYSRFICTVLLALICGEYEVFDFIDIFSEKTERKGLRLLWLILLFLFFTLAFIKISRYMDGLIPDLWRYAAEGFCTLSFVLLCKLTLCRWRITEIVFSFLGKHSMNMYFVHLFFMYYCAYTRNLIFATGHFMTVYLTLVAVCLGFSICLELLKKLIRYPKLAYYLTSFFDLKMLSNTNKE